MGELTSRGSARGVLASHSSLEALRLAIRQRLRQDTLFPAPSRVWSGAGRGRFCVVCDRDISAHEIETEMILGPVTLWAHLPCYTIWREESVLHDEDTAGVPQGPLTRARP